MSDYQWYILIWGLIFIVFTFIGLTISLVNIKNPKDKDQKIINEKISQRKKNGKHITKK